MSKSMKKTHARVIVSPIANSDTMYPSMPSSTFRATGRPNETQSEGSAHLSLGCFFFLIFPGD